MPRKPGPTSHKLEQIRLVLQSAEGPLHLRELARRLEGAMSYPTVCRYLNEFMSEEISIEGKYGPHQDHMVFVELK